MVGSVIENYKIISVLGEGGMGVVYKALDMKLERFVALKILSTQSANNPQFIERFKREARNQAKLTHPNIVPVYGFTDDHGILGIAMEFVEGDTLEKVIYKKKRLDIVEALEILKQILEGVAYAHTKGFIHRDIKPSNIIITRENSVKIMDFGISKSMFDKGITKTGTKIGTILYMSPEQIRAEEPTRQSDIYSIGITFYEMLVGKTPFDFGTEYEIMEAHLKKNPGRVSVNLDSVPPEIDKIVAKSLDKSLQKRYMTCEEFLEDVEALLHKLKKNRPGTRRTKKEAGGQAAFKVKVTLLTIGALAIFVGLSYVAYRAISDIWPSLRKLEPNSKVDTTSNYKSSPNFVGKNNWSQLATTTNLNLNSLYFCNSEEGYAVGEKGTIIRTSDAGYTWQKITPPDSITFHDVYFANSQTGFVIGEKGRIFQTNDAGLTWKALNSGVGETLFRMKFFNNNAFIIGSKGVILRSNDNGQNWTRIYSNTDNLLYGISFSNASTGFIVGWNGTILKTNDGGASWFVLSPITDKYLKDIVFVNESTGFIAGAGGEIMKTTNGGDSWKKIESNVFSGIVSMYFANADHGYAVSNKGEILETLNGGNEWNVQQGGNYLSLSRVYGSGSYVFVSGFNGLVLRTK